MVDTRETIAKANETWGAVVLCYGQPDIEPLLSTLFRTGLPIENTIIVIQPDGNEISYANASGHPVVESPKNLGYGAGMNEGAAALPPQVDIVLLATPDITMDPQELRRAFELMECSDSLGILGPRLTSYEGVPLSHGGTLDRFFRPRHIGEANKKDRLRWIDGAAQIVRRGTLPLPEKYFMYWEDIAFSLETQASGSAIQVAPDWTVATSPGTKKRRAAFRYLYWRNRIICAKSHGTPLDTLFSLASGLIAALYRPATEMRHGASAAEALRTARTIATALVHGTVSKGGLPPSWVLAGSDIRASTASADDLDRRTRTEIVVSTPASWSIDEEPECVEIVRRNSDWGASRTRSFWLTLKDCTNIVSTARGRDLVITTIGPRFIIFGAAARLCGVRTVTVFDHLISDRLPPRLIRFLTKFIVDQFVVIRTSDTATVRSRYPGLRRNPRLVRWPAPQLAVGTSDGGYFYSAGWAHRDWQTLAEALALNDCLAIVAPGRAHPVEFPSSVQVLHSMPDPAAGRELAANARGVVVLLKDGSASAGPLVLLDAMAMGKPVVVNRANGNVDYVDHQRTGLVVEVGDAEGLAETLTMLDQDGELREKLGEAARAYARKELAPQRFWEELIEVVRGIDMQTGGVEALEQSQPK